MGKQFPGDPHVRVSDTERSAALAALSQFYAEGRLSMEETDERCNAVAGAKTRDELNKLFTDLPQTEVAVAGNREMTFTATEVDNLHKRGARPRAGILGLTTVGSLTTATILATTTPAAWALLALIPVVFILLYVMKVGPADWYAPSARQLERERMEELRKEEKLRDLEMRARRKELTHSLTHKALKAAESAIPTRKKR
ncbi:hypothetical protein CFAEC_12355 [Corynebacterium faecale]|uniref:DUF1707 SHOCT-like domain-containing protein n=1 Tax=Corynebacterium faecale TaxID=1758466 RepID=UPI0025B3FF54|nr:DUF1707 domain-containing protein [Corynebacterium faecale]WJY93263.1 hypothetical protein CFAEC_12355 [Corynebacterium faecale]